MSRSKWNEFSGAMTRVAVTAAMLAFLVVPGGTAGTVLADTGEFVLLPEGGRLDALDEKGQLVGPCPLKHTDVDVEISGHFTRVNVTQKYHNPYDHKIEAVYTFPLSHRGAVDRMTMTVGDRIVEGEVKQRDKARRIYESAREAGHVASLLEQERPNIFTQSVANIEPDAEVKIEISYVETLESTDGRYRFHFPTVVAPRYTPGQPPTTLPGKPEGLVMRQGVVLPAPAKIEGDEVADLSDRWLRQYAVPVEGDSSAINWEKRQDEKSPFPFQAKFEDGQVEHGAIFADGVGHCGGRWFFCPPRVLPQPGEPFALDTDQVPDASRVTPMPVKPDQRAGHDISIRVTIDTGGPGIVELGSEAHEIVREDAPTDREDGLPHRTTVTLKDKRDIPNRDFRLWWRLSGEGIEEALLKHTGDYEDFSGGFFTLILQPPNRIPDEKVRPRELIFVLDQSGSMTGSRSQLENRLSLEAAKEVIGQAIETMRHDDRFNLISFNNDLNVLWNGPRPNTAENRTQAQRYIDEQQGGGGTEMRNAVLRALGAEPFQRHRPQPDAEGNQPMRIVLFVTDGLVSNDAAIIEAIRKHADQTRVFAIGMSHAPNRHLLDEMARVGRGAVDYVLPENEAEPIVQRFADRIATPVLTDIELEFDGLDVTDVLPSPEHMIDLFDVQPLVIHGRYDQPGEGTLTIRGRTGEGPYKRTLDLTLPEEEPEHDMIATLWAREKVGELMRSGGGELQMSDRETINEIVQLGETFQIVTHHTSFVAVERQRVTIDGQPKLIRVPIEFPKGMSWEGIFGSEVPEEQLLRQFQGRRARGRQESRPQMEIRRELRLQLAEEAAKSRPVFRRPKAITSPGEPAAQSGNRSLSFSRRNTRRSGVRPTFEARGGSRRGRSSGSIGGGLAGKPQSDRALGEGLSEVAGKAYARNADGRPIAQKVAGPGGSHLVAFVLPDLGNMAERLRELLSPETENQPDAPVPVGRLIQPEKSEKLHLLVAEPATEIITPFAKKLADDELTQPERRRQYEALMAALKEQLPRIRHDLELRRRLETSLYKGMDSLRDGEQASDGDPIRVTVLLNNVDRDTLTALEQAGFRHEATVKSRSFVIGRIPPERLETVALLRVVRRIEPL